MQLDELLQEYSASRTQFSHILNDTSLRMGFECEMVSGEHDDDSYEEDDEDDEDYQQEMAEYEEAYAEWENWEDDDEPDFEDMTFDEMENTDGVTIGDKTRSEIKQDYREWKENRIRDEWNQVRHSYVPAYLAKHPDRDKSDAYHSWLADRPDRLPNPDTDDDHEREDGIDAFILERYGDMKTFMDEMGIEWESGNERPPRPDEPDRPERSRGDGWGSSNSESGTRSAIAHSLSQALGVQTTTGSARDLSTWRVISDMSIEGDGIGAEVVSGVYPLKEALNKLQACFKWMNNDNMETNDSTGLHVSFSIEGKQSDQDYDFLKMMMFFDENYTAELFGRLDQDYAKQMRNVLFTDMQGSDPAKLMASRNIGSVIGALKKMGESLPSQLGREKYHSFRHRANGVIEFRNMGSSDYQDKFEIIRNRIINMAYVMKVGSDPALMQREYLMNVYKMLTSNKFSNPALVQSRPAAKAEVPYTLNAFTNIIQRNPRMMAFVQRGDFKRLLKTILIDVNVAEMSRLQIRQLRYTMAKNKLDSATVRTMLDDDPAYNRIANMMRWPMVVPGAHPDEQETLPFAMRGRDYSGEPNPYPDDAQSYQDQRNSWNQVDLPHEAQSQTRGLHQNARTTAWGVPRGPRRVAAT